MNIQELIKNQKQFLIGYLKPKIESFIKNIDTTNIKNLDNSLFEFNNNNEFINLSYVLDANYYQISSNITTRHIKNNFQGQDLSARPFLKNFSKSNNCYLTDSYLSTATLKPCISLVYGIKKDNKIIAILVLDLDLIKLPLLVSSFATKEMEQIKGDKSIRSGIFNQIRNTSVFDTKINEVHKIVHTLITKLGVFHIKLHYSSSRVTIWQYQDPYNYLVLSIDDLLTSDIYLLFPKQNYPKQAKVGVNKINKILDNFKYLRFMDENMYLRAGSFNIINGTIGINFSCDGYHYLQTNDFLDNFNTLYA
jgi:hypothetical protein